MRLLLVQGPHPENVGLNHFPLNMKEGTAGKTWTQLSSPLLPSALHVIIPDLASGYLSGPTIYLKAGKIKSERLSKLEFHISK